MSLKLIEPRIDLTMIQLFAGLADAPEHQWLRVGRMIDHVENIESDTWSGAIVLLPTMLPSQMRNSNLRLSSYLRAARESIICLSDSSPSV